MNEIVFLYIHIILGLTLSLSLSFSLWPYPSQHPDRTSIQRQLAAKMLRGSSKELDFGNPVAFHMARVEHGDRLIS